MESVLDHIRKTRLVPVIKIEDESEAVNLAKALLKGGLSTIEITFRTTAAAAAIRNIANEVPEMLVGAGTVLTKEHVDLAVESGAKFIVSPGLNPMIVEYCQQVNIPIIPGIATASEIEQAMSFGLKVVKFFPAEINGGIAAIKALSAPYSEMEFMPTGGINPGNLSQYLSFSKVIACGGTWMVDAKLLEDKNYAEIELLTAEAVLLTK